MEYLLGGLCLLAAVTVIGHGLWVLVSLIFSDPAAARFASAPRRCPRCSLPLVRGDCDVCHWPRVGGMKSPNTQQALDTLEAQITQLGRLSALDPALYDQLIAQIVAERTRLAEGHAARAAEDTIVMATPVEEAPARQPPPLAPIRPVEPRSAAYAPSPQRAPQPAAAQYTSPPAQSPPPQAPARSWTDWLAGFMEERNIRWGELVGGLLIVCSSIALVISFWSAIDSRPWLKFLLFNGVTAAIFGVGFYSEYRWRLKTTSRGLLTIGCMLVPLNFLAIAAFSSAPGAQGLATIAGEALSAALFAVLVYFAGQVLTRRDESWLTLGLLVPALSQLLVRRLIDPHAAISTIAWVAAIPTVCYLAVNLWHQRSAARELVLSERQVHELFRFLGLTSFAVVLPLALLLYKTGHPILTLRQLPALAGLLGFVPLSAGLLVWQQLAGRSLAALRTAGTAVGVFGAAITLAGLVIGWPEPSALVPAALLEFLIFSFVAWRFGIPAAHLVAAACLAVAYLLLAHWSAGEITWSGNDPDRLAETLLSGESGTLLAPLVLLYAGLAFVARRRAYDGWWALAAAFAACMAVSVALLAWFGWGNRGVPLAAGWIYLLYAACWLAIAARQTRALPSWIGLGLLLAGIVQEVVFHYGEALGLLHPLVAALLIFSSAAVGIALFAGSKLLRKENALADIAWRCALGVSLVAAAGLVLAMPTTTALWQATHWAWVAVLWGSIVLVFGWLPVGMLFQVSLTPFPKTDPENMRESSPARWAGKDSL
jgi:hypothetical protein